jgi:cell wall-associated NlpC family hydrolase
MARTDEQLSFEQKYLDKMKEWADAYKTRTDFASKFKLDYKKTKGVSFEQLVKEIPVTGNTGSAEKTSDAPNGTTVTVANATEAQKKLLTEAQKWIGKIRYQFGASNPPSGQSDCSGFTSYVYRTALSIDIGRATDAQSRIGTLIPSKEDAQPGDLILFQGTYRAGPSHVGIVYEWPKFIHCGGGNGDLNTQWGEWKKGNYYDKHFLSIRRVLKEADTSPTSSNKTSARSLAMDSATGTNEAYYDRPDDEGMESFILNGQLPTTNPGAPSGSIEPPDEWLAEIGVYNPISLNKQAGNFKVSTDNRAHWLAERIAWGRDNGFKTYQKIDSNFFVHLSRHDGFEGNLYSPDAAQAFEIFRLKSKREKIEILSGFRYSPDGLLSPHEAGCAIDIRAYGIKDAREIADIAWACGFKAIAIGGDLANDTGFVHLDIGPKSEWGYDDVPMYQGPGRWSLNEV